MEEALEPVRDLIHRVKSVSRHRHVYRGGLRVVREPKDAEIDIVAVHGLGGEGFSSWVTWDPSRPSRHKSWLEELLAQDVPNARIMTYAYMADVSSYRYLVRNVLYGRAVDLIRTLAAQRARDNSGQRPLFFIAHSLGGWIVKRALIISSESADLETKDIELSTCGIAFFGTLSPGKPSAPSPLAQVLRRTSGLEDPQPVRRSSALASRKRFSLLSDKVGSAMKLQPSDVEWLENQLEAFKAITAHLPRLSFHETLKSPDGFIVDKRDSVTGSDGLQIALSTTHADLVRFRGRDANYRAFIDKFRDMLDKAMSSGLLEAKRRILDFTAAHRLDYVTSDYSIPNTLPVPRDATAPRKLLDDRIEEILRPKPEAKRLIPVVVTLWGRSGMGKTTLASRYAEKHHKDISFVLWLHSESWETLIAGLLQFADSVVTHYSKSVPRERVENDLGFTGVGDMLKAGSVRELDEIRVKSMIGALKDWLMRPGNGKWLIVFDDISPTIDIEDYVPLVLSGRVIITSRREGVCSLGRDVEVGSMEEQEAAQVMKLILGPNEMKDHKQTEAAVNISKKLEYHPRAIALAASTMKTRGMAPTTYYDAIDKKDPVASLNSAVGNSPMAKTMLQISSMLSTSAIPVVIFTTINQLSTVSERVSGIFSDLKTLNDGANLKNSLQCLLDRSIIQIPALSGSQRASSLSPSSSDLFVVDPAVRKHTRDSLSPEEKAEYAWIACKLCADATTKETGSDGLVSIHKFGRTMAPHTTSIYDDWSNSFSKAPQEVSWHILGNICAAHGAVSQAVGYFELALKQHLKPTTIIETTLSLASLLQQAHHPERSRGLLENVSIMPTDKRLDFRLATARARAAGYCGALDVAASEYETLEQEQEQSLGPTDLGTMSTVHRLSSTLEELGKLEESRALQRRVYITYQYALGQAHPLTMEALDDLARLSSQSNAIDDAESLYAQYVNVMTSAFGPDHPSTAVAMSKHAVLDDLRCRFDIARDKYRRALVIIGRALGPAHPLYTTTMENMALSARLEGQTLFDREMLEQSRSIQTDGMQKPDGPGRAFQAAEETYLEVLQMKTACKELYSKKQALETANRLREMYEDEDFFNGQRIVKESHVLEILRG